MFYPDLKNYNYTDAELVSLLQQGDIQAFDTIYERYVIMMLDTAFIRLRDRMMAEDIVQNVFMRFWNKREDLQISNLGAYFRTAVRYEVLTYVTRTKKLYELYEPFELLLTTTETADEKVLSADILKLIHAFAKTLPLKRKEAFLLYLQQQYSTQEIADEMGISQKTVQKHLNIALSDFRTRVIPVVMALIATRL